MAKDTRTYQEVTNLPDQPTQAFRGSIFPSLTELARRTPSVYGAKWNDKGGEKLYNYDGTPRLDPNSGQQMYEGAFVRDPSVPLTASQNAEITQAANQIKAMQGAQTGTFQKAATGIGNASGMDIYGAGSPAYDQAGASYGRAAGMDIYGAGAGAYGQAGDLYNQAAAGKSGLAGQGQFNAATGMFEQAANTDTAGQYQPYGAAATGLYGQSTDALGLSAASPYLQAAGQSSAQNVGQYMNPYNEQVTNRIAQLGARNLSENILPQISSDFIKAGGYGSTRQRDLIGRAARDTQESILGQQSQALQAGYGQGLTASAADLARYGNLAGTAGGLGTQQQQLLQGAASGISGVGQAGAGFAGSDAARKIQAGQGMFGIGQANIQASQNDLARVLAAGQGQAGIGAGLGNLMQANQAGQIAAGQGQAGIGAGRGNLMQANAANQLAVGRGNIDLANAAQSSALQQTAALQAVGEGEQAQQQREIDANRGQVAAENAAPFYNVGQASAIAGGAPAGGSTGSTTTSAPSPSMASQLGGLAVGIGAKVLAKGGAVKKGSLKKSSYGKLPKRGLGMFARAS